MRVVEGDSGDGVSQAFVAEAVGSWCNWQDNRCRTLRVREEGHRAWFDGSQRAGSGPRPATDGNVPIGDVPEGAGSAPLVFLLAFSSWRHQAHSLTHVSQLPAAAPCVPCL